MKMRPFGVDAFRLSRFLDAQASAYPTAFREICSGRKQSHWIWFVFPQLRGLGSSDNSEKYGLSGLDEARAYLAHPVLGGRLREATTAMMAHRSAGASSVLAALDALKLRSCLTLFSLAEPGGLYAQALQALFDGERDRRTLELLGLDPPG